MKSLKYISRKPEDTTDLGMRLGELSQPGDIFLLRGRLGAGKTCLTQGIARGLGSRDYVSSPTFVLMHEINGRLPLYHIDLYRLDRIEEMADLGLDDYLYGQGLTVIEWAEKGLDILPSEHLLIKIEYLNDHERSFELVPRGNHYKRLLEKLNSLLSK